jgi:YesN/AraC family two-component response regulator
MYSNKLICEILIYIDKNIKNKITIEELENKFFYNRYYIMKLFKKEIGLTIVEYINSIRIYNSILLIFII